MFFAGDYFEFVFSIAMSHDLLEQQYNFNASATEW
jgi:hypothetical protein